ncbi:hypothetical protein EA462_02210 [Natrarchaeobius halalkaliphilus]|uniref:Capsular biosynthesis protein n=1 Tax=Natrarchaeobius halalkaliphilus TaxID=1679091 RepID=A0A3N6LW54_9EURY|nr:hypothetical protein [Natrarchaeobius halalkaliphilus]RQG93047.1 hypothetical protein EA462_02210 [Natrarchaeobius halalkaliphilus]
MSDTDDILLVPSAVLVPDELRLDVGSIPTGMIPLKGKPMIERIAEAYESTPVSRIVAVGESSDAIREYAQRSVYDWRVIDVGDTISVGETILTTLEQLPKASLEGSKLYINFADTLIQPIPVLDGQDYVSYEEVDRTYRWTNFDIESDAIGAVTPKNKLSGTSSPVFVGQFGITDASEFRDELERAVTARSSQLDPFFAGLLSYLSEREYDLFKPDTWLDVGHLDTFHQAKKQFLNTRSFNKLYADNKNTITKRSDDVETLINEIEWYNQIPNDLQPYLPRVYDWSTNEDEPFIKLEYIGYPSLSDLQLYSAHGQHIWNGVFDRLLEMIEEFQRNTLTMQDGDIESALETIYIEKTRHRLERTYNRGTFTELFDSDGVTINGVNYPSVREILAQLQLIADKIGLLETRTLSVIHGDLCFPNILYDPRNGILKLIDPRGEFGDFTIYGDSRYDLAKLRHSVVGHYEHLINDQFDVSYDPEEAAISYRIHTTEGQDHRESLFDSKLASHPEIDLGTIKFIEALLFLSMVPLHADRPARQQCMIAQGIQKIAPYMESATTETFESREHT